MRKLLGHTSLAHTAAYLGVGSDEALALSGEDRRLKRLSEIDGGVQVMRRHRTDRKNIGGKGPNREVYSRGSSSATPSAPGQLTKMITS